MSGVVNPWGADWPGGVVCNRGVGFTEGIMRSIIADVGFT